MTYYRVKPEYDSEPTKDRAGCHIGSELLTEKEVERGGYIKRYLEPVEISYQKTYWMFGVRRAMATA